MLGSQLGRIINRAALSFPLSDLPFVSHPRSTTVTLTSYTTSREILVLRALFKSSHEQCPESPSSGYVRASFCSRLRPCQLSKSSPYVFHARFLSLRAFILCEHCLRAASFEMRVHAAYVRAVVESQYLSVMQPHVMPSQQS